MSKKWITLILLFVVVAGFAGYGFWQIQSQKAKAAKLEAEILKGLTADDLQTMLAGQAQGERGAVETIVATVETRQAFLKGLREYFALAAEARREGLVNDPNFQTNFEYKKNRLLAELYQSKLSIEQGKIFKASDEEMKAVWSNAANEAQFKKEMDAIQAIQMEVSKETNRVPPVPLQAGSLAKARESWAAVKILSDKAKADAEFMQKPELALRFRVLEAGILSADYLRKHFSSNLKATDSEIAEYLRANPQYDLKKKREKAETILQKVLAGEDFAKLAKEFSEHRPTKATGGLFEDVTKDQLSPELERAALALNKGQIADHLIETEIGLHIIKLEDKSVSKDKDGNETIKYSVRHILFQNAFEQPGITDPNLPPPFLKAEEIAKAEIEKEKRNKFVAEIVGRNQISLPDDFTVVLPEIKKN
jgi:PPIC-type PPIASE domain